MWATKHSQCFLGPLAWIVAAAALPTALPAPAQAAAGEPTAKVVYSPWIKFCAKGDDVNAKRSCITGTEARLESGTLVVAAALIEPDGESRKLLRVVVPLGMLLSYGARVVIDEDQPISAAYVTCHTSGCAADYEVDAVVGKLKKGRQLIVQAVNATG